MNLKINDDYYISDITPADKPAFLEHFKTKQIHDQTLNIPYPYSAEDADWWIDAVAKETKMNGQSVNWAIRRKDGYLIGGIGFHGLKIGDHKAEIGYWLAESYWGNGIMTEATKKVTKYGLEELGLIRITAHVFDFNEGSARVVEKSGYKCEGILRKHYKKNGKIFDGKVYSVLAGEI